MNIKEPVVLKAPTVDKADTAYEALAKRLGVPIAKQPSDLMLRHALSTLSIAVYDYSAVRRYLIDQKPNEHCFCWVRATSASTPGALRHRYPTWDTGGRMRHGHIADAEAGVYNKPIPYPALLTMESIAKKGKEMGFKPHFYVSDYAKHREKPKPRLRIDPFLAVGTSDSDALFVIERWDEPGFREEVYSTKKKATGRKTGVKK